MKHVTVNSLSVFQLVDNEFVSGAIACNLLEKLIVLYFTFVPVEPQKLTLNVVTPTLVWMVSLYVLKLETFKILQLIGFILMVLVALIFNEIIPKIGNYLHNK